MTRTHGQDGAAHSGRRLEAPTVMPVEKLVPHPRNARRGDVDLLVESLTAHGQYAALVVQSSTLHVLRGNHLLAAAKRLGWTELSVQLVDVDDDQALRILLVDNRSSDRAGYDVSELVDLLGSLPTLEATGYSDADLAELLERLEEADGGENAQVEHEEGELDDDKVDDERERRARRGRRVRAGDVVALDGHRIVCGDPRDVFAWGRVLGGATPQLLIVRADTLDQPAADAITGLLSDAFATADLQLEPGAGVLVFRHGDERGLGELAALGERFTYLQDLVYLNTAAESTILAIDCMPFAVAHTPVALARKAVGPQRLLTARGGTSVWAGDSPTAVAVAALTDVGADVAVLYPDDAEPLLACEQHERSAYLLQPDPMLVDAIVDAWEEAGGDPPRRQS